MKHVIHSTLWPAACTAAIVLMLPINFTATESNSPASRSDHRAPSQVAAQSSLARVAQSSGWSNECGSPKTGDCCEGSQMPFCNDADCCSAVCAEDSYCCDVEWNECCAELAAEICQHPDFDGGLCDPPPPPEECALGSGSCCTENDTPGCEDIDCCATICADDPFCCNVVWDALCASAAGIECIGVCTPGSGCGWPDAGNCCEPNETPHCEDVSCCTAVCACDPYCCEVEWDEICALGVSGSSCNAVALCGCNPADLTGNNDVNGEDLLILLSQWGECPGPDPKEHCPAPIPCPADFNGDGVVDGIDLLFLLQHWSEPEQPR